METNSNSTTELAARLRDVSAKNTAEVVYNRINLAKQKNSSAETINMLEQIINDLTSDKNELLRIASCYEEEFMERDISDSDIEYITRELVPIASSFLPFGGGNSEFISSIEKILSAETLKILKLLGFNYKDAIGQPLTSLVAQAIQNQTNKFVGQKGSGKK